MNYGTITDNRLHPAPLPTTKAIYQAIIDKLDERLEGGE